MPLDHHWFIDVLRSGDSLKDKEIGRLPALSLDIDHTKPDNPTKPFEFVGCTFHVSPTLPPATPPHGHPALVFDHCTFKNPLKLTNVEFHREVIFRTCRFERYVDFTDSRFLQGASLEDCSFDEKAYFEGTTFGVGSEITVGCPYCLKNLKWECTLVAQNYRSLSCSLGNSPKLHNHEWQGCASFRAAVFNDGAEFDDTMFHVPACFHKTTWYEATTFLQCQFPFVKDKTSNADIVNFSYAQIAGSVEFNQSLRPTDKYAEGAISEKCIHANFKYIHVHKEHGLQFHTENLKCCSVLGTNLNACHFSNVRWPKVKTHYPLTFYESRAFWRTLLENSDNRQNWVPLVALLELIRLFCSGVLYYAHKVLSWPVRFLTRGMIEHRSDDKHSSRLLTFKEYWRAIIEYGKTCGTLEQYGIWDHVEQIKDQNKVLLDGKYRDDKYSDVTKLDELVSSWRDQWALLSRAYRDLKTAYERNKDYIYASDFHYAEKEFRRINYEVPRQIRIQLQLYWLVSGYGERVLRPVWWFLLIWILGAIPYACSDQVKLDEQASVRATQSR